MKNKIEIRIADSRDASEIAEIYAPYVENTAITFEYSAPSASEFEERINNTLLKYPFIAALKGNKIVGYAYAGAFKERPAYDWDAETSIYVAMDFRNQGIGRLLYEKLEELLKLQGILNLNACAAYCEKQDEYLTNDSILFHEKLGYTMAGRFKKCGYKFNRWYDMVWMEKHIGNHLSKQKPVKSFSHICK